MKSLLSSFFRRANTPPPIPDERSEHFTNVMLPAMEADMELRNEYGPFDESAYERFKKEAGASRPAACPRRLCGCLIRSRPGR